MKITNMTFRIMIPVKYRTRIKSVYNKIFYFGFKYKCPICNSHLRTFLPFGYNFPVLKEKKIIGGGYRQKVICPVCGSFDRDRLLYLYLLHKTDIFKKQIKLLHVAPEAEIANKLQAKKNINYLTADIASKNVMVKMDITNIQFPDNSFDVIICNHVLEHIIDDSKAMSELYRILKPGGWAILMVPLSLTLKKTYEDFSIKTQAERERAFGQRDHVRIYAEDYQDRLERVHFKVDVFKWIMEPEKFGKLQNIFGLNEEEHVYFVSKYL